MKLIVVVLLATLMQGIQSQSGILMACPEPEDIEHGSVRVTQYSTIYYARYTCDVGYERNGSWYRDCDLLTGEWEGPAPTCEESNVDCGHPGKIQYGKVNVSEGTKLHASIHYTCDGGYIRVGWPYRTCRSNGAWSGREPTCAVSVDCGHPGNVNNGTVDVSRGTKLLATAWIRCDDGLVVNGSRSRTCQPDGRWSGTTPTCVVPKACPQPEAEEHGSVTVFISPRSTIYYARYTCDVGYEMRGFWHRSCDRITGEWVGTAPTCEETNCGHPGNITNGIVNVSEGTKLDAKVYYICDEGYRRNGLSYRTCSSRGTWSRREPTCEAIDCGHPGNITNGTVNVSEGTKLNAKVYYICDEGYRLNGPSYRTCSSRGTWAGREPTCEAIDCGHPREIFNGRVDVSEGTKLGARVRYSCKKRYKLKGPSTRKCKQNGRWDQRAPTCKKKK